MKLFITHTFKGEQNRAEIEELCSAVRSSGWEDYSFVRDAENFSALKSPTPVELMTAAKKAVESCDALILDITDPSLGKGIEAGIAYESGKKIIVIIKKGAEIRRTAYGIADLVVEYQKIEDIISPLNSYLLSIKHK